MKENIRNFWSFFKKQWLMIWIVLASFSLTVIVATAAFLDSNTNMKRVVVATAQNGKMFSSDWLYENGIANHSSRRQQFAPLSEQQIEDGDTYDVTVHIFNFDVNNPKKHYSLPITYKLIAKMVLADGTVISAADMGSKTVSIDYGGAEPLVLSSSHLTDSTTISSETLAADPDPTVTSQNSYVLSFSGDWDLDEDSNIYVELEAVRTGDSASYKDITDLGGKIGISRSESGSSFGWDGQLNETGTPDSYDGYNFVLTGSGEAKITFEWDPAKISVNRYFYYNDTGTGVDLRNIAFDEDEVVYTEDTGSGWSKLVITADSNRLRTDSKYRNRYEFQLYKTAGIDPSSNFVSVLVTSSGTEMASKTGKWIACTIQNIV